MSESQLTRRQFITRGTKIIAAGLIGSELYSHQDMYLRAAGKFIDWLIPPTSYGFPILTTSAPRKDNTPTIDNLNIHKSSLSIQAVTDINKPLPMLTVPELSGHGQFSMQKIASGEHIFSGCSIITTREGLQKGRQEYCALFVKDQQILAVGYESNRVAILDKKTKEWEDLVTAESVDSLAVISISNIWPQLVTTRYFNSAQGMLEIIEYGNQALAHHEHKPYYGVLASTKMPNSSELQLDSTNVVQSPEEAFAFTKPYYITEDGVLIDMIHITDKPRIVLQWLMQLQYYKKFKEKYGYAEKTVKLNTNYLGGDNNQIEFAIDTENIEQDIKRETLLLLMSVFTSVTEGVLQYEVVAQARKWRLPVDIISKNSGYSPEDAFTNSLAAEFAYRIFNNPDSKYAGIINKTLSEWINSSTILSSEELNVLAEKFIYLPEFSELRTDILKILTKQFSCRALTEPITVHPLGLYPFNPVKIDARVQDPLQHFTVPQTTAGIRLLNYPNWAESLPQGAGRLSNRLNTLIKRVFNK